MDNLKSHNTKKSGFLGDENPNEHILSKYRYKAKESDREIESEMSPDEVSDVISDRLIKIIEKEYPQKTK